MAEDDLAVRRTLTAVLAVVVVLGVLCGWLGYRAFRSHEDQQRRAAMIAAGRQVAADLTTIDYAHAEVDVQRVLDSATGGFYDDFKARSGPFVDVVTRVQSRSVGTVTEAALESLNGREGTVLTAVSVATTTAGAADPQPRYWRMRLTVVDEGSGPKVAKVEFVP